MSRRWPTSIDYTIALQSPNTSFRDLDLRTAVAATNDLGLPRALSGNFADVYQLTSTEQNRSWAVKCFTRRVEGLRERYREISRHLEQARLPLTVGFEYLDEGILIEGQWHPVLKMDWVSGLTLRQYVEKHLESPRRLEILFQGWRRVEPKLRKANVTHGDLQHGNVLLVPGENERTLFLKLIDYDGMWIPSLAKRPPSEVGHPAYQHPQRSRQNLYTSDVDRFPHLVIACALKCLAHPEGPRLWRTYDNGDNLLFSAEDFGRPSESRLLDEIANLSDPLLNAWVQDLATASQSPLEATPLLSSIYSKSRSAKVAVAELPPRAGVPETSATEAVPPITEADHADDENRAETVIVPSPDDRRSPFELAEFRKFVGTLSHALQRVQVLGLMLFLRLRPLSVSALPLSRGSWSRSIFLHVLTTLGIALVSVLTVKILLAITPFQESLFGRSIFFRRLR